MTIEHKLAGSSILVVEDDPDTLELLAQTFAHLGANVRRARSAEIAFALLAGSRMDAVLCDLQLPDVDGYALLERIRATPALCGIPVVAISGSHPAIERGRAIKAGFARYISKPSRLDAIVETLRSVIAGTEPRLGLVADQRTTGA
jgi:CheY-like chemotaxis protein